MAIIIIIVDMRLCLSRDHRLYRETFNSDTFLALINVINLLDARKLCKEIGFRSIIQHVTAISRRNKFYG